MNKAEIFEKFTEIASHAETLEEKVNALEKIAKEIGECPPYYSEDLDCIVILSYETDLLRKLIAHVDWEYDCVDEENISTCEICGKQFFIDCADDIYYSPDGVYHAKCYFTPDGDYEEYLEEADGDAVYLPDYDMGEENPKCYAKNATFMGRTSLDTYSSSPASRLRDTFWQDKVMTEKYGLVFAVYPVMRPAHGVAWRGEAQVWAWRREKDGIRPLTEDEKLELLQVIGEYLDKDEIG